jgi:eukaryotic-like serine/threonine-protein kinase
MAIAPGTKLGPYEIIAPLGAGGMGEVYRAHDSRLDRDVAIKVLPEHLMSDASLRLRFEREAKAICKLSHPNICTLHDIGNQDGIDFLVMELIEGETLEQRLARGPLSSEQTLKYSAQIAEALAKAHSNGIVHRDLKPSNVMLTKSGAKLMDFGLAKQSEIASFATAAMTEMTKDDARLTGEGTLIGTFQYMSPEQLEGKTADARSDIFALGELAYEMVTGKPAFAAKSRASLIAAILTNDPPPMSQIQPMTPPALERVVKRCLSKDPDERWQSASDLASELNWILAGGSQSGFTPQTTGHRASRRWMWMAAVVAFVALAALMGWYSGAGRLKQAKVHLSIALPDGKRLTYGPTVPVAISPDGKTIMYSAFGDDRSIQLYQRKLDSFEATPIAGTEGAISAIFSPDGEWIAFTTLEGLKKVSLRGGSPVLLSSESSPLGIAWSKDNTIYFIKTFTSGIYAVPAAGGVAKKVTPQETSAEGRVQLWPSLLPDDSGLIFTTWTGKSFNDARIDSFTFKTGTRKRLLDGGTCARYVDGGHLLFARNATLYAAPFDLGNLTVKGSAIPVLEGVMMGAANGNADYVLSADGTLVYNPGEYRAFQRRLVWMDRAGKITNIKDDIQPYSQPTLSPDGSKIALTLEGSSFDVWVYDLNREVLTKASFGADDYRPSISPDGKMLAYDSSKTGRQEIFLKHGILEGEETQITTDPDGKELYGWMPNGRELIYGKQSIESGWDIYAVAIDGDHKIRPLINGTFNQTEARISPDGKWIAYLSDESGRNEVFVVSATDPTARAQISTGGGKLPRWSKRSDELLFTSKDRILSVKFAGGNILNPSKPVLLFEDKAEWSGFDVAADGRLVVAREAQDPKSGTRLNVILNWAAGLGK